MGVHPNSSSMTNANDIIYVYEMKLTTALPGNPKNYIFIIRIENVAKKFSKYVN